jgi:hypothetical protein
MNPATDWIDFISELVFEAGATVVTLYVIYGLLSVYMVAAAYLVIPLLGIVLVVLATILLQIKTKRANANSVSPGSLDTGRTLSPSERKIIKYMSDTIRKKNRVKVHSNMAANKKNIFRYPTDHVHKSLVMNSVVIDTDLAADVVANNTQELLDALDVILQRYYDKARQSSRINNIDVDEYQRYKRGLYDPYLFSRVYEGFITKLYAVYYPGGTVVSKTEMDEIMDTFRACEISVSRGCTISTFKEWLVDINSTLLRVRAKYFYKTDNLKSRPFKMQGLASSVQSSRTVVQRGPRTDPVASAEDQQGAMMFYKEEESDSENSSLSSAYSSNFEPINETNVVSDEVEDTVGGNHYKSVIVTKKPEERKLSTIQINRRIVKKSVLTATSDNSKTSLTAQFEQVSEGDEGEEDSSLSGFSDLLETHDKKKEVAEPAKPVEQLRAAKVSFTPKSVGSLKSTPTAQVIAAIDVSAKQQKQSFVPKSSYSHISSVPVKSNPVTQASVPVKSNPVTQAPVPVKSNPVTQASIKKNASIRTYQDMESSSDSSITSDGYSIQDSSDDESKHNEDSDSEYE